MNFKLIMMTCLLALAFVFAGCSSKVEDTTDTAANSQFQVTEIEVVGTQSYTDNDQWPDLKNIMLINLRTCLKDSAYRMDISGSAFEIRSDLSSTTKVTNINGCISWSEEIQFNYLEKETFFEIEGDIIGSDNYKGIQTFKIAVNPWSEKVIDLGNRGEKSVVRLTPYQVGIRALGFDDSVVIENASIKFGDYSMSMNSTEVSAEVAFRPEFIRVGLEGETITQPLTRGLFDITYFLLEKSRDGSVLQVLAQERRPSRIRRNGKVKEKITFAIKNGVGANSTIEVAVKVSASNSPSGMGGVEGVFVVKTLRGGFTSNMLDLSSSLETISDNTLRGQKAMANPDRYGFVINEIKMDRGHAIGTNKNVKSFDRGTTANVSIQLVDSLIKESILDTKFNIVIKNKETEKEIYNRNIKTDMSEGKLKFQIKLEYSSVASRDWSDYTVEVKGISGLYSEIAKRRLVYINPFSENEFCIDSKDGEPIRSLGDNTPQIQLDSYGIRPISTGADSFKINKHLNMSFKKTVQVTLFPKFKFAHDYNGDKKPESIMTGQFKMRFLVLIPKRPMTENYKNIKLTNFNTLTAAEKVVAVEDGRIDATIDLPLAFTDLVYYSNKNLVFIELSPVDSSMKLKTGYLLAFFSGKRATSDDERGVFDSGKSLTLASINWGKLLTSKIKSVQNKLAKDSALSDSYEMYSKELGRMGGTVIVGEHKIWSKKGAVREKKIKILVYDGLNHMLKNENLPLTATQLEQILHNPEAKKNFSLIRELCHIFYNSAKKRVRGRLKPVNKFHKTCYTNPLKFIEFNKMEHIRKIIEQPMKVSSVTRTLSLSSARYVSDGKQFASHKGKRDSNFSQWGWDAKIGAEFYAGKKGLSGFLAAGLSGAKGERIDIYTTKQTSEILTQLDRAINQDGVSYPYERFDLTFRAQVKSCLLITPKSYLIEKPVEVNSWEKVRDMLPGLEEETKVIRVSHEKRIYVCLKKDRNIELTDSWYYLYDKTVQCVARDCESASGNVINVIRGKNSFLEFRDLGNSKDTLLILKKTKNEDVLEEYNKYMTTTNAIKVDYKKVKGVGFPGLYEAKRLDQKSE